ncbi:staphylopine family metallophore export MFS transporter CntE [Cohnella hongkongensis]|uniref:Staphylopine family metallophore export MFS transporter CntE n=1 Tax=Cohnella hongkongensis TaxID=178337 RepID=A0ABV9F5F1_9BACL
MTDKDKALSAPFLRLYALALLFFSANAMLNVIIPLRSAELGASNGLIGFIMGAYMLTCMVFRPWAGHWIRRLGPAAVLRVLLFVNGAALVLYTFAGLEGYLTARVVQGVCTAFFSMALQIGIIDALPDKQRSQGISLYSLSTYMPSVIGPLIAVAVWDHGGMDAFSVVLIGLAAAAAAFGYLSPMQAPPPGAEAEERRVPQERRGSRLPLLVSCGLMLTASVVFGSVSTFTPLYAKQIEGGNAGVYFMLQASVIVVCRFFLSKRIPSDGRWPAAFLSAICLCAGLGSSLLALSQLGGAFVFYISAALIGLAQALLYPTLFSYLTFVLPEASRNVRIGLFIAAADLGVSLGGFAMGPVADRFSYGSMYAVGAGLAALAACSTALLNRPASSFKGVRGSSEAGKP